MTPTRHHYQSPANYARARRRAYLASGTLIFVVMIWISGSARMTSSILTDYSSETNFMMAQLGAAPSDARLSLDITFVTTLRDMSVEDLQHPPDHPLQLTISKQMNALRSWSTFVRQQNIIVFADSQTTCSFLWTKLPDVNCVVHRCGHPEYVMPQMNCIFGYTAPLVTTEVVAYLNADIVIFDEFTDVIQRVYRRGRLDAIMVGQRTDVPWTNSTYLDFTTASARAQLRTRVQEEGALYPDKGVEYIVFRKSLLSRLEFPPLLLGIDVWDSWWLSECIIQKDLFVIDVTKIVTVMHQGNKAHKAKPRFGALYNEELAKKKFGVRYRIGRITYAPWYLDGSSAANSSLHRNTSIPVEVMIYRQAARVGNSYVLAVMTVNAGYAQLALNWLCWVRRTGFNNFILLAEDKWTARFFREQGLYNIVVSPDAPEKKSAAEYGSIEFQVTMTYRTSFLGRVLNAGVDFMTGDLDSIWLDNPLTQLDPHADLQGQPHKGNKISGGLVAVKATQAGRFFWHKVIQCQLVNMQTIQNFLDTKKKFDPSKYTEQECINDLSVIHKGLVVSRLDVLEYPDGRAFFDLHLPQKSAVWPTIIHNNWIVGVEAKTDRFKRWNMWIVTEEGRCMRNPAQEAAAAALKGTPGKLNSILPWSASPRDFNLHIRIVTGRPLGSASKLLQSLLAADIVLSGNDRVNIEIFKGDESFGPPIQWPHGTYKEISGISEDTWMAQWRPAVNDEALLVLEDSSSVSKYFYRWAREAFYYYHLNQSNHDSQVFGIALHDPMEGLLDAMGENPSSYQRLRSLIDPAPAFRSQSAAPWGTIYFADKWLDFSAFYNKRTSDSNVSDLPCIPGRSSNKLWCKRRVVVPVVQGQRSFHTRPKWSHWHTRYAFEQGLYALFLHFPEQYGEALIIRKGDAEFEGGVVASELVQFPPSIPSVSLGAKPGAPASLFRPPFLLQLFDFQFLPIKVDASILTFRSIMFTHVNPEDLCSWRNEEGGGDFDTCAPSPTPSPTPGTKKKD